MKTYKSKISIGLVLFLLLLFGGIGFKVLSESFDFLSVLLFLVRYCLLHISLLL